MWRRISLSPLPASPVKRGEPFMMIVVREPLSSASCMWTSMWSRNRVWPSLMLGRPGPKRPDAPRSRSSACRCSTFFLVGASTQSSRRSTVSGRMTSWYLPRMRSATPHRKLTISPWFTGFLLNLGSRGISGRRPPRPSAYGFFSSGKYVA